MSTHVVTPGPRPYRSVAALAGVLGGVALAAPMPDRDTSGEGLTKAERAGLVGLHRDAVEVFVDRPGFGVRRMDLPLADVLNPPKSLSEGDSGAGPAPSPPADRRAKPAHFSLKGLDNRGVLRPFGRVPAADAKAEWKLKEVLLIGLVKHPEPVVYLTGGAADVAATDGGKGETPKAARTRKPDEFEAKALEVIQGGGGPQAERRDGGLRAVAAVYAGQRCLGCHDRRGEMLGAFAYRLELVEKPVPPTVPAPGGR